MSQKNYLHTFTYKFDIYRHNLQLILVRKTGMLSRLFVYNVFQYEFHLL